MASQPKLALTYGLDSLKPQPSTAIVKGILHTGSITLIYGPPKSGKSFLATDLFASIASADKHWMDHRIVSYGPVLYVTCEGHAGFWKRLQAFATHRWKDINQFPDDFVLASGRPPLVEVSSKGLPIARPDSVLDAVNRCEQTLGVKPIAVAIDTVFRSFGQGNVNSADHMMAYVEACQKIVDTGAAVALIHHATKALATPAGSVSLMGACDTIINTTNGDGPEHTWQIEMAKDDAETDPRTFRLDVIEIGTDLDGEPANSCVVIDMAETLPRSKGRPKLVAERDLLMRLLHEVITDRGHPPNGAGGVPPMIKTVVEVQHWRALFMLRNRPDDDDKVKRQAFRRMVRDLQANNQIGVSDKLVWAVYEAS